MITPQLLKDNKEMLEKLNHRATAVRLGREVAEKYREKYD